MLLPGLLAATSRQLVYRNSSNISIIQQDGFESSFLVDTSSFKLSSIADVLVLDSHTLAINDGLIVIYVDI